MLELDSNIIYEGVFHSLFGEEPFTRKDYTLFILFADAITLLAEEFEPVLLYLIIHYLADTYEVTLDLETFEPKSTILGIQATYTLSLEINTATKEILSYTDGKKDCFITLPDPLADKLSKVCRWAWELEEVFGIQDYLWATDTQIGAGFRKRFAGNVDKH